MTVTEVSVARVDDDLPHRPVDEPLWSENFFFSGYDPQARVGFMVHVATVAEDPSLWSGLLAVYLPDGDVLVAKDHGRCDDPRHAGPPSLRLTCREPLAGWNIDFDGVARRVPGALTRRALVPDGISVPLRVQLEFTGRSKAWSLAPSTLETQDWAKVHLEQSCTFTGMALIEGRRLDLDGPGFRDHTTGPRDVSPYVESSWVHATFPSGLAFMGMEIRGGPGEHQHFRSGFVLRDGFTVPAMPDELPRPNGIGPGWGPGSFRITTETEELRIEVEVLAATGFTLKAPQEWCHGVDLASTADELLSIECPARYRCDGEEGFGHFERILRASCYQTTS